MTLTRPTLRSRSEESQKRLHHLQSKIIGIRLSHGFAEEKKFSLSMYIALLHKRSGPQITNSTNGIGGHMGRGP